MNFNNRISLYIFWILCKYFQLKHLLSKFKLIFSSLLLILITSTPFTNICFTVTIDGLILNGRYLLGRRVLYRLWVTWQRSSVYTFTSLRTVWRQIVWRQSFLRSCGYLSFARGGNHCIMLGIWILHKHYFI